jgi:hypothetical protein
MAAHRARVLFWAGIAALVGVGVFGFLAWRSVTVEPATLNEALRRFEGIRDRLAATEPMLQVDADGSVTRHEPAGHAADVRPSRLRVLAYRAPEQRLVRADLPFWFVKVKGPAVQYALHDTGLDMDRLGVTPWDLERCGICLILDETRANGDRLLVWSE